MGKLERKLALSFVESALHCANVKVTTGLSYYVFLFNSKAGVFMGFSITSAVLGGLIIICYSMSTFSNVRAITVIILILGIIAFAIGIWAAVYLCSMKPCTCCATPVQQVSFILSIVKYI